MYNVIYLVNIITVLRHIIMEQAAWCANLWQSGCRHLACQKIPWAWPLEPQRGVEGWEGEGKWSGGRCLTFKDWLSPYCKAIPIIGQVDVLRTLVSSLPQRSNRDFIAAIGKQTLSGVSQFSPWGILALEFALDVTLATPFMRIMQWSGIATIFSIVCQQVKNHNI